MTITELSLNPTPQTRLGKGSGSKSRDSGSRGIVGLEIASDIGVLELIRRSIGGLGV